MSIEKFAAIIGIAATIITGIYFIVKEFKSKQLKFRRKFQNEWRNEGDVLGFDKYTHFINIEINVDMEDGEISGVLQSRSLSSDHEIENVSINGRLFYKSAVISLADFKGRQLLDYGKARLTLKGKIMHWKLIKGDKDYFPSSTILWN